MNEIRPESYWTHLYWLTVLEEQKSYTRAAEKLAVSKSAISQKISELERITGKKAGASHDAECDAQRGWPAAGGGAERTFRAAARYFRRYL